MCKIIILNSIFLIRHFNLGLGKWITANNPVQPYIHTLYYTMVQNGYSSIFTATWIIRAKPIWKTATEHTVVRRESFLIETD